MLNTKNKVGIAIGAVLCLNACSTTELNKSEVGALFGGLIGAVAGATVDKSNPARGAAIGAGIGSGAGYLIGKNLDKRDQASLKAKIEEAAAQNSRNAQTVWKSDHSGASATITPIEAPRLIERSVRVAKDNDVVIEQAPLMDASGQRQATADVNVRVGPGTQHAVKDLLRQGQVVDVIGTTHDGWYVIAQGNTAVGYVSERYLQKPGEHKESRTRQDRGPVEAKARAPQRKVEAASQQARTTQEVDVRIARTCRPVQVRIRTANGQVTEETMSTCQNPDGSWGA